MKNVVIDTNVLMSGIFFGGLPAKVLEQWYHNQFKLVITEEIYSEYIRVYDELQHKYPGIDATMIMRLIISRAKMIKAHVLFEQVCSDKDDDKFIACALSCKGTIISGDKALLAAQGYQGIVIITPRQFVN